MWSLDQITMELDAGQSERDIVVVNIITPAGSLKLMGEVRFQGRMLRIDGVHINGESPVRFGREGLNAIGRKLLEWADVDEIILQGGVRTTGANPGSVPRPIRFPKV